MKIYVAEEAGFCFGVKRALEIISQLHEKGEKIQIFGQLIHNKTVLNELQEKGIDYIDSFEEFDRDKTLVIRTHGLARDTEQKLISDRVKFIDATCPLVKKLHNIINELSDKQTDIIIVGNKNHPEIIAAKSYSPRAVVINSVSEAKKIKRVRTLSVIAQTTLDLDFFKQIIAVLIEKADELQVVNTICNATKVRQKAIKELSPKMDAVVVIGNKNSSNTNKLYNIARKHNKNTFYVETSSELEKSGINEQIGKFNSIGITAGASTPPQEVEKVKQYLINLNLVKERNNG